MPSDDKSTSKAQTKTSLTQTFSPHYNESIIDTLFVWLDKADFDYSALTKSKEAEINRIIKVINIPLISLIYTKRDDGLKHPYGYGDQKDSMKNEDYRTLIALAGNEVPFEMRIAQVFDHLGPFRYLEPAQPPMDNYDSDEEESSPFEDSRTLEYKLLQSVIAFCEDAATKIDTIDENQHFNALLTRLRTEGAASIWEDIKYDMAYRIELDDPYSWRNYQTLMDEAQTVKDTPLETLPSFTRALQASQNYQAFFAQEASKKSTHNEAKKVDIESSPQLKTTRSGL